MFSVITGAFQITAAGPHIKALTEGRIAGKLAFDVIDFKPTVQRVVEGTRKLKNDETTRGDIEFVNVDFCYPGRQDLKVLKGLSCSFKAGETTAIVGPSGSGKSTVVQLIERFYNPKGGQILFDGQDIEKLDL